MTNYFLLETESAYALQLCFDVSTLVSATYTINLFYRPPPRHDVPSATAKIMLPMGDYFVDGNIFMKSGVYLRGW